MNKPKEPLIRIMQEGRLGTCPKCGSSEIYFFEILWFHLGKSKGCIQPECENYCERKK